jgi:hypothetical protein
VGRRRIGDVRDVLAWIRDSIRIDTVHNYARVPLSPRGVCELRLADPASRDIFFVALCRSFGILSRLEPATRTPQYFRDGAWHDVLFNAPGMPEASRGYAVLVPEGDSLKFSPEYFTHYSIGRFDGRTYRTLDFEGHPDESRPGVTISLVPGTYMLTTGNRLSDGSVLCRVRTVRVAPNVVTRVSFAVRETADMPPSLGTVDLSAGMHVAGGKANRTFKEHANGRGLLLVWIDPDREPSKHVMADLRDLRQSFEKWDGGIVLFLPPGQRSVAPLDVEFPGLPPRTALCEDPNSTLLERLKTTLSLREPIIWPLVVAISPSGDILYHSEGYRIGTGEQVLRILNRSLVCRVGGGS